MSTTESTSTKNEQPNYRLRRAGVALALTAAGVVVAVTGKEVFDAGNNFIEQQHDEHAKTAFYSQKDLAADLKAEGKIPKGVGFYDIEPGDNPTIIARKLGAEDVTEVAGLISRQAGDAGDLHPGSELALPLDAFNPEAIDLVQQKDVISNPDAQGEGATITYIVPAKTQQ